ncbi:hypothetical protein ACFSO0_15795 [Brevibacillus sp. GCM10020057]
MPIFENDTIHRSSALAVAICACPGKEPARQLYERLPCLIPQLLQTALRP